MAISCYKRLEGKLKELEMDNLAISKELQVALKTVNNIFDQ
mgnify:CR=1 FL=1